jgi:hypothetical protein
MYGVKKWPVRCKGEVGGYGYGELDGFFVIICPYLNMPLPEMYPELHGWFLTIDKRGTDMILGVAWSTS